MGLIEILVALAMSTAVIGTVIQIFINSKQSYEIQETLARMQENGRHALQLLGRDVRMTGYVGEIQEYWNITESESNPTKLPATISGECFTAPFRWVAPMLTMIDHDNDPGTLDVIAPKIGGANNGIGVYGNCVPAADQVPDSDIITLHFVGPEAAPDGTRVRDRLYIRTDLTHGKVFRCNNNSGNCTPVGGGVFDAETDTYHPLQAIIYYVRKCRDPGADGQCGTTDDGDQPNIPSLVKVELQEDGTMVANVVAEGIADMQIQYGIDTNYSGYASQYKNANDIGNVTDPGTWLEWNRVKAVRIWLLVRSTTAQSGFTDNNVYQLGDHTISPANSFRHQLFTMTAAVRNFSE